MNWFQSWAIAHIRAHGLRAADHAAVLAWESSFSLLFTSEELHGATRQLLTNSGLRGFANEHRGAIINAVETGRRKARQTEQTRWKNAGCDRCSGSGWVIVPHPGYTDAGERYHYLRSPAEDPTGLTRTMAVCCLCDQGSRTRRGTEEMAKPAMAFHDYQRAYSNWHAVEEARAAVTRAEFRTAHPDDVATLTAELAKRTAMPGRSHSDSTAMLEAV